MDRPSQLKIIMGAILFLFLLLPAHVLAEGPVIKVTQVDASEFPHISIYVSVTDESGRPVAALSQDDFRLTEDGTPVEIIDFAGATESRSVDIVFVFDTTGSMDSEIDGVKNTSIAFANKLRDNNRDYRLGLVAFGDDIRDVEKRDGALTADAEEFKKWIGQLRADGGGDGPEIALDATERATQMTYRPRTQKVLILITDAPPHQKGDGTRFSHISPDELMEDLSDQGFTVYAVAFDDHRYRRISNATNGEFYDIDREPDFTGIIDKIGGLIATQYRLTYVSNRPAYDGTRRAVEVTVGESTGESTYLEQHLVNINSNAIVALVLLVPLLVLLALPRLFNRVVGRRSARRQHEAELEAPGAELLDTPVGVDSQHSSVAPASQLICQRCGHQISSTARFCNQCGQVVQPIAVQRTPAKCPHCNQPVRDDAQFCGSCGKRLGDGPPKLD